MKTKPAKKARRLDLNPSSADRWTTCTASPQYIFDNWHLVKDSDTKYNREGTTAHEVAAALLQDRQPDLAECPVPITPEMRQHGWNYMEYVMGLKEFSDSKIIVEHKMPLWYMPARNAKVDAAVVNPNSLHVIDYKYGEGIIVSTEGNKQGVIYCKSIGDKLNLPDDFHVFIHIYQPRGRAAEDSPFHVWQTTWGEIQEIAADVSFSAVEIQKNHHGKPALKSVFAPSEKACQWCDARGFCEARNNGTMGKVEALSDLKRLDDIALPTMGVVTINQLAKIIEHGPEIKKWIDDAGDYALEFMKDGGKIPGQKLVLSRGGNRFWTDPVKVGKLLVAQTVLREKEVFEVSTISPAAVEKLLGKNQLPVDVTNLIGRPKGQPTIAPESDKRDAILLDAADDLKLFDVVSTNVDDY